MQPFQNGIRGTVVGRVGLGPGERILKVAHGFLVQPCLIVGDDGRGADEPDSWFTLLYDNLASGELFPERYLPVRANYLYGWSGPGQGWHTSMLLGYKFLVYDLFFNRIGG